MLKSFSYRMVLDFRIQPDNWQGKHPASGLFLAARGAILCPSLPSPLACVCRLLGDENLPLPGPQRLNHLPSADTHMLAGPYAVPLRCFPARVFNHKVRRAWSGVWRRYAYKCTYNVKHLNASQQFCCNFFHTREQISINIMIMIVMYSCFRSKAV